MYETLSPAQQLNLNIHCGKVRSPKVIINVSKSAVQLCKFFTLSQRMKHMQRAASAWGQTAGPGSCIATREREVHTQDLLQCQGHMRPSSMLLGGSRLQRMSTVSQCAWQVARGRVTPALV